MNTSPSLAELLPRDVLQEIDSLEPLSKAILLVELADEILESQQEGFMRLPLSATTTQNIKALTTHQTIQLTEYLCKSLRNSPSLPR